MAQEQDRFFGWDAILASKKRLGYTVNMTSLTDHVGSGVALLNASGGTVAEVLYLYDAASTYNTAPTAGKLAAVRTLISGTSYSQVSYAYDNWGNRTTVTNYSGYGTASTAPTTGARSNYTCYGGGGTLGGQACTDDGFHSYALWSMNALSQRTVMGIDCTLGVPSSETDPNGLHIHWAVLERGGLRADVLRGKVVRPGAGALCERRQRGAGRGAGAG